MEPAKDEWGNLRIGLEAKGVLNRKDYGIMFSQVLDRGQLVVGDEVEIEINDQAINQPPGDPCSPK